jgi:hypothetical protein
MATAASLDGDSAAILLVAPLVEAALYGGAAGLRIFHFFLRNWKRKRTCAHSFGPPGSPLGPFVLIREGPIRKGPIRIESGFSYFEPL